MSPYRDVSPRHLADGAARGLTTRSLVRVVGADFASPIAQATTLAMAARSALVLARGSCVRPGRVVRRVLEANLRHLGPPSPPHSRPRRAGRRRRRVLRQREHLARAAPDLLTGRSPHLGLHHWHHHERVRGRVPGAQACRPGSRQPASRPLSRHTHGPLADDHDDRGQADHVLVHIALHAGSVDPGGGPAGTTATQCPDESGGFVSFGRVGLPPSSGYGSIVTYKNGTTQLGAWKAGVPARGVAIASVRQNLHLLIATVVHEVP